MNAILKYLKLKGHLLQISRELNSSLEKNEYELQQLNLIAKYDFKMTDDLISDIHTMRADLLRNSSNLINHINQQVYLLENKQIESDDCLTDLIDIARHIRDMACGTSRKY